MCLGFSNKLNSTNLVDISYLQVGQPGPLRFVLWSRQMLQTTISTYLNAKQNEVNLYTKADSGFVVVMINSKTPEWVLIVYKPHLNLCLFRSYEMYTDIWSFKWCIVCQVQQEIFETCQEIKSRTRVYIGWKGMWIWWWTTKVIYVGMKVALFFWM